jgi:alpha-glucosidase (family GH31 glycosyl hydrolase)
MKLSLPPWGYGVESVELCRRYANLHMEFAPKIFTGAQDATHTGEPIIRPVFWHAPNDACALARDDEFLLGEAILFTSVVSPSQRACDSDFFPGQWRDFWTGELNKGIRVLKEYPAPLDVLPFFGRC